MSTISASGSGSSGDCMHPARGRAAGVLMPAARARRALPPSPGGERSGREDAGAHGTGRLPRLSAYGQPAPAGREETGKRPREFEEFDMKALCAAAALMVATTGAWAAT